jgi:hypothetical protein
MRRGCSLLVIASWVLALAGPASASVLPQPMRDAVDAYAVQYAADRGLQYIDRLSDAHGDYKRAYFTLLLGGDYPTRVCHDGRCWDGPRLPWTWKVQARAVRCGADWYVVSTPLDPHPCRPPVWHW